MAVCPNKNSEDWRYLVEMVGETQAFRIFMANDNVVPKMAESTRIGALMKADFAKEHESQESRNIMEEHNMIADPETTTDNTYRKGAKTAKRLTEFLDVFKKYKKNKSEDSYGERKAQQIWDRYGYPPDKTIDFGHGELLSREQYVEKYNKIGELAKAKGTILHGIFQYLFTNDALKKSDIENKLIAFAQKHGIQDPFETFGWLLKKDEKGRFDIARRILSKSGINVLENIEDRGRDKVNSEVRVMVDELGLGATIDTLVEHADGYFSIVEWKTGQNFPSRYVNRLMKYGNQTIDITDNPREHAKLQIMLQAVMLKANNPHIQFRHLRAHWIQNEMQALREDFQKDVEVEAYLNMVEQFLKTEMPDAYEALKKKSPRIFNPDDYNAVPDKIIDELTKSPEDVDVFARKKHEELAHLRNFNPNNKNKHKIAKLSSQLAELVRQGKDIMLEFDSKDVLKTTADDVISFWKKWAGHSGSVGAPITQLISRFMKQRKHNIQLEIDAANKKFNALMEPIYQDYLNRTGKKVIEAMTRRKVNLINYDGLYGFMWKGHRFVTKNDAEYKNLTTNQQKLVDYVNDTIYQKFGQILNTVAFYDAYNRPVTHLDLIKKDNPGFEFEYGFAPKVVADAKEILAREGFGKRYLNKTWDAYQRRMYENYMPHDRTVYGLEIKYLGSPELDASENYTRNVQTGFDMFMRALLAKEHLDDVYHFAYGVRDAISLQQYENILTREEEARNKDLLEYIENRIVTDIQGKRKRTQWMKKPMKGGTDKNVNIDGMIRLAKNSVGWTVMWVKPIAGTANGLFTHMVTVKEAIAGSLAKRFHGLDGQAVDFTVSDLVKAHQSWLEMNKDAIAGNIRSNKLWLLARKFKYLPDNFEWANRVDQYTTKSNPLLEESTLYASYTIWEEWVAEIMLASMMQRMKTKDGRSVWDAYEVQDVTQDGVTFKDVVWTGGVRGVQARKIGNRTVYENIEGLTWQEIEHMKRIYERVHGAYRKDERTSLELFAWGETVMQYKKYIPSIANNLFDSMHHETYLGDWQKVGERLVRGENENVYEWVARKSEGRARTFYKTLLAAGGLHGIFNPSKKSKNVEYKWSNLTNEQKKGIVNMYTTAIMYFTMLGAYFALFRNTNDDDSWKRLSRRIMTNFSQQYNPIDLLRTLRNPIPVVSKGFQTAHGTAQLMLSSAMYLGGDREPGGLAITQDGRLRGWTPMQKHIPFLSSRYEITRFIENALEDTESAMHWDFKSNPIKSIFKGSE